MGRPKKAPPVEELPNRLAPEKKEPKTKKTKQALLPDGDGGVIVDASNQIPEIQTAAEAYRLAKEERKNKTIELKDIEDGKYDVLKETMEKHVASLGPSRVYIYTDDNDVKRKVSYEEPGVTVSKVKVPKAQDDGGIVSDPNLQDDLDEDEENKDAA